MKITPKDTVSDVVMRNRALFSMGTERIVKTIQDLPEPEFVPIKRRMWFDKRLPVRDIAGITMGELNAIVRILLYCPRRDARAREVQPHRR